MFSPQAIGLTIVRMVPVLLMVRVWCYLGLSSCLFKNVGERYNSLNSDVQRVYFYPGFLLSEEKLTKQGML